MSSVRFIRFSSMVACSRAISPLMSAATALAPLPLSRGSVPLPCQAMSPGTTNPAGHFVSLSNQPPERVASVSVAPVRSAPSRLTSFKFAPVRSAPANDALRKWLPERSAPASLAPEKSAWSNALPVSFAPVRVVPANDASLNEPRNWAFARFAFSNEARSAVRPGR